MHKSTQDTIVLVDSNALVHRAYHAFPQTLRTRDGKLVNAAFGFAALLLQVVTKFNPKYLICVFDSRGKTFRHELYADYKATRREMDVELAEQLPVIDEIVAALNIPRKAEIGMEADDIIGSLACDPRLANILKIIVTGDRDLLQLSTKNVDIFLSGSSFSKSEQFDTDGVAQKLGFAPELLIEFKALRGDTSDNIPGVRGVGEKTATDLVQKYGTLEQIYEHLSDLPRGVAQKLETEREMAFLSRRLATIKTDCKVDFALAEAEIQDFDFEVAKKLFTELEFKSLLKSLFELKTETVTEEKIVEESKAVEFTTLDSINFAKFGEIFELSKPLTLVIDQNENSQFSSINALAFSDGKSQVYIENIMQLLGPLEGLSKIFAKDKLQLIAYDTKSVIHLLRNNGCKNIQIHYDLLLAEHLLAAGSRHPDLETIIFDYTGENFDLKLKTPEQLCKLASLTHECYLKSQAEITKVAKLANGWSLQRMLIEIEQPLVPVLVAMEHLGVILDSEYLLKLKAELQSLLKNIEQSVFASTGSEFNLSSPKQLGEVLFDKLKLPGGKKTKSGGYTTNERVLGNLLESYPFIEQILEYRTISKLLSTYTDALIKEIKPSTGRIHTDYRQAVAATGRLSSTRPNLQNIPISSELGKKIRQAFIADQDKAFVFFDYSQQELRILAHLSKEEKLITAFAEGQDIHAMTAAHVFQKELAEVSAAERRAGKTINFGIVYGISGFGLAERLRIGRPEAQQLINAFFESYPRVRTFYDELLANARKDGYVSTILGRRKNALELNSSNFQIRSAVEREVMNFPLQGSAAEMMKQAMIAAQKLIDDKFSSFAKMVLQIHDELVFEVNTRDADDATLKSFIAEMAEMMLATCKISVPMKVDAEFGLNLNEKRPII